MTKNQCVHIERTFLLGIVILILGLQSSGTAEDIEVELTEKLHSALKSANPDYSGMGVFKFRDGKLVQINLMGCKNISDLSPLQDFDLKNVVGLILYKTGNITDLSPIAACQLQQVNLEGCEGIKSLAPLAGMPIVNFRMCAKNVTDLSPLKGMPLKHLDIGYYGQDVTDLSPLKGMQIEDLRIDNCRRITDLSPIADMPLRVLSIQGCVGIKDYSPLMKLTKLEKLFFSPELMSSEEIKLLRNHKSIQSLKVSWNDNTYNVSGKGWSGIQSPEKFWQRYDAGEFMRK